MRLLYSLQLLAFILCGLAGAHSPARAQAGAVACAGTDKTCLLNLLENSAAAIPEESWRDGTWREAAKLLALEGRTDDAIAMIARIKNPDTQAMTIRGIGMAAAKTEQDTAKRARIFTQLHAEAAKITHP